MDADNMQAVIDAAREGAKPENLRVLDHVQIVYLPHGRDGQGEVQTIDVEKYLPAPVRKAGRVTVFDAASFNNIITANRDAGDLTIYVDRDVDAPKIVGVLNGHGANGPGWGDFRASVEFRPTPQWKKWRWIDGKMLPQVEFADFVEDNLADIAEPAGAAMLEIASYLQATRSVNFRSGVRLSSGAVQFRNEENIEAKVGAGETIIPEMIALGLAPFVGLSPFRIAARFRYRVQEGRLLLGVKLQRVEDLMEQIVNEVVSLIEVPEGADLVEGVAP